MEAFAVLNSEEQEQLIDAIANITILIAGADGEIDVKETSWAEKLTKIRSYSNPEALNDYYSKVAENFNDRLKELTASYPKNVNERTTIITDKLNELNYVLAKLDSKLGSRMYDSFTSFAEHVAKASGGFMRFFSVSKEEQRLIDLPMINPIYYEEEE